MCSAAKTAQIITVGDELLSGAVVDTNTATIGRKLRELGVTVLRAVSVGDDRDEITHAVHQALDCDLCLVSGGLGPTSDDRTAAAVATALGRELKKNSTAEQLVAAALARLLGHRQRDVDTSSLPEVPADLLARNVKQAWMPAGAKPLANLRGTAPGIEIEQEVDGRVCWLMCLPGVPSELAGMLDTEVTPRVRARFARPALWQRIYRTFGVGESWVAREVEEVLAQARKTPELSNLQVHYLAKAEEVTIGLELPQAPAQHLRDELDQRLLQALGARCYGIGTNSLPVQVVHTLTALGHTIATADACTGGQMGVLLTAVPGASRCLVGGVDAYANGVKTDLLAVSPDLLARHGAVSKEVAVAMARGVRARLGADIGVALTGIAGPTGGSPDKPVGTIELAICDGRGETHRKVVLAGSRVEVQRAAAARGISLVWRRLAQLGHWTQEQL